jgi:hypothetical protein
MKPCRRNCGGPQPAPLLTPLRDAAHRGGRKETSVQLRMVLGTVALWLQRRGQRNAWKSRESVHCLSIGEDEKSQYEIQRCEA